MVSATVAATVATRLRKTLPRSAGRVKVLPRRVARIPALLPAPKLPALVEQPSHGQRAVADVVAVVLVVGTCAVVAVRIIIIAWRLQMHELHGFVDKPIHMCTALLSRCLRFSMRGTARTFCRLRVVLFAGAIAPPRTGRMARSRIPVATRRRPTAWPAMACRLRCALH